MAPHTRRRLDKTEIAVKQIDPQLGKLNANYSLKEKICQIQRDLEQKVVVIEKYKEELTRAQEKNKEPSDISLIDIPLKVFSDDVVDIPSLDLQFTQNVERMVKESENLHVEMAKINFQNKPCTSKK